MSVEPLYDKLPAAIIKSPDDEFHNLLTTIDALREQKARERNLAHGKFKMILDYYAKQQNSYNTAHQYSA